MEQKNIEFIKRYYGDEKIRELLFEQAKNYTHCIGAGKTLIEKGWTLPIREVPIEEMPSLLDEGLDIFFPIRCVGDKSLYIIWDIEYFNKENPAYIFDRENQKKIFAWLAPALDIVEEILKSFGIKYVVDITMSGIHVWSKISAESETFSKFADEGFILPTLAEKYSKIVESDKKRIKAVPSDLGKAYNTAGKILEFFTHELIKQNRAKNPFNIPVTISDAPQLGEHHPHSGVSSDITQYGHPIFMRCIRAFCSLHQKSLINGFENLGPAVDMIKVSGLKYSDAVEIMWDADESVNFYKKNFNGKNIEIGDSSEGWSNAFKAYFKSELRVCHKEWENAETSLEIAEEKYPLISRYLNNAFANPGLLAPGNLQEIAEEASLKGTSATKKIFSMIADFYSNESLGWYDPIKFTGINWNKYDAMTAADFWGRAYWSLKKMGLGRKNTRE